MIEVVCFLITIALAIITAIARPDHMTAPRGWHFDGVRPNGETTMRIDPPAGCGEPRPPNDQPCTNADRAINARIYCTGGAIAILVGNDDHAIGCQRRFQ